jgi:hypothetical protein
MKAELDETQCELDIAKDRAKEEKPDGIEALIAAVSKVDLPSLGYRSSALVPTVQVVERFYCKRPIQCLASSKILTPHSPTARRVCTPAFVDG